MTDIAAYMRLGGPCIENNAKCRTMDAASGCACAQAADTITTLRAEIERLRAALEYVSSTFDDTYSPYSREGRLGRLARAVLAQEASDDQ
jgi:hypothetical protein